MQPNPPEVVELPPPPLASLGAYEPNAHSSGFFCRTLAGVVDRPTVEDVCRLEAHLRFNKSLVSLKEQSDGGFLCLKIKWRGEGSVRHVYRSGLSLAEDGAQRLLALGHCFVSVPLPPLHGDGLKGVREYAEALERHHAAQRRGLAWFAMGFHGLWPTEGSATDEED